MAEAKEDWSTATVIDADRLGEHLIEQYRIRDSNIYIRAYSVAVKDSGIDEDGLARYVADQFQYFVYSKEEIREFEEEDKRTHRRAQKVAKVKEDYVKDGTLGELFLFLLTDGFLDVPMISHKIANKQSFEHEVYGADGIFFGDHEGREKIGIGEAKVRKGFSAGLEEAITSVFRFHSEGSATAWEQELNVAPSQLSENLKDPEQIEKISEVLTEENYAEYPVFHPIFISYESEMMKDLVDQEFDPDMVNERIRKHMERMKYVEKCKKKIGETGSKKVNAADLVFFHLPTGDLDRFRRKVLLEIFPSLEHVMDDVIQSINEDGQS